MGTLTPNAHLTYKREGNITYSQEEGKTERVVIGYDFSQQYASTHDSIMDSKFWGELRREAQTNVALQNALSRAIMIFNLSKAR